MAIITKSKIVEKIKAGEIVFKPEIDTFQLQDHSVDLRLGFTFLIHKTWKLTPRGRESLDITHFDKNNTDSFDVIELEANQYFDLLPGECVLVSTLEAVKIPKDLMAVLYPRSSTNRKGLSLDLTGIVDSGYEGQLVLPIRNNTQSQVVRLFPGERLCQLVFEQLDSMIEPKKSKYHRKDIIDGVQKEKINEARLVMSGKIKELKEKYRLK